MHCVLHRQHLVLKCLSPRLQESLGVVVKAISMIKANVKSDRLFRQLCEANDEEISVSLSIQKFIGYQKANLWQDIGNFKTV